jgi:hypothetical protein
VFPNKINDIAETEACVTGRSIRIKIDPESVSRWTKLKHYLSYWDLDMKDIAKDLQYFIERRNQLAHPKINNYKFVNKTLGECYFIHLVIDKMCNIWVNGGIIHNPFYSWKGILLLYLLQIGNSLDTFFFLRFVFLHGKVMFSLL